MHEGRTCEEYDADLRNLKDQTENSAKSVAFIRCGCAAYNMKVCSKDCRHSPYGMCAANTTRAAQSAIMPLRRRVDVTTSPAALP